MYSHGNWDEDVHILMCGVEMQLQEDKYHMRFQKKKLKLDIEIDDIFKLMHISKRNYSKVKKMVKCEIGLTMRDCKGKLSGVLQNKVWKPRRLELVMKCDDNKGSGQLQHKVWDLGRWSLRIHEQDFMKISTLGV